MLKISSSFDQLLWRDSRVWDAKISELLDQIVIVAHESRQKLMELSDRVFAKLNLPIFCHRKVFDPTLLYSQQR